MATNTYVALDKVTVGTATASVTFSSIPATYTDLVIVVNGNESATFDGVLMQVGNGTIDTGSNYSVTRLRGNGSTASSGRDTSATSMNIGLVDSASMSINIFQFMNYANTTTYKTILSRGNATGNMLQAAVGLWRSTTAITTIKITAGGGNWNVGSTFSLYGIASQEASAKATGGIVTSDATYYYHTFTSSGTFTPTQSLSCDVLVVAGGGAGGNSYGGGGGSGGVIYFAGQSLTATGYTCTVGAGGTGRGSASQGIGASGVNSSFGVLTAAFGGGGGGADAGTSGAGQNGGSGGGGSRPNSAFGLGGSSTQTGTGATAFYGNAGGGISNSFGGSDSGGGGAGAAGTSPASATVGGNGGIGTSIFSSWGLATGSGENSSGTYYYAGGGAGNGTGGAGTRGLGGGGAAATNGTINTGGGGGGDNGAGMSGGSGLVIVRYAK